MKWASLLVAAFGLVAVVIVVPGVFSSRRASNERHASATLKTIASAQADFRGNDRDGNFIQDFWTGDVAGLYKLGLIPRELAEADAALIEPLCPKPRPYQGYFFVSMDLDRSAPAGERAYRTDTDGSGRKLRHLSRFGFCAYPAEPGVTGGATFIINEGNTIFKANLIGEPQRAWPIDDELKTQYFT